MSCRSITAAEVNACCHSPYVASSTSSSYFTSSLVLHSRPICSWVRAVTAAPPLVPTEAEIVPLVYVCAGAIETITSSTRTIKRKDGTREQVLVWNATVANLSLMALGSSAPEILLSVIELLVGGFRAGDLGPGTIVGSAAFNLLVITAICVMGMPAGETRLIRDRSVFALTTTFSIVAYVWLLLIVSVITPGFISIWEALITFLAFFALIFGAYAVDKGCWRHKASPVAVYPDSPPSAQPQPQPQQSNDDVEVIGASDYSSMRKVTFDASASAAAAAADPTSSSPPQSFVLTRSKSNLMGKLKGVGEAVSEMKAVGEHSR